MTIQTTASLAQMKQQALWWSPACNARPIQHGCAQDCNVLPNRNLNGGHDQPSNLGPSYLKIFEGQRFSQHLGTASLDTLEAGILSDIFQKTALNFVVAVMAATSAVKGGSKLHTSMIRALSPMCCVVVPHGVPSLLEPLSPGIGTQWLAACVLVRVETPGLRMAHGSSNIQ